MGKISNYARVLKAKLQDAFVIDSTDSNVTSTKSVTVEQIGDAICGEQVHATLETDDQTIIGGINELAKDKNVADEYDDTHTYNIGDITIYGNTLYICNTNNTTGTFDPSKWTATTIDNIIGSLSQLTTTDKSSLVGAVNELAPTAYTQATRSSALSSGALGFVKIGKVVIANLNYTTNTSNVSTHDTVLYSDLPPAVSNIYLNFVDEVGNVTRVRVGTDGKMHLHYSTITANKEINGSFVYLSA